MDIAFIGFGEAAQALIDGWAAERPAALRAFDIKTDDSTLRAAKQADYRDHAVVGTDSLAEAVAEADLILSLVTADQSLAAAKAAAPLLRPDALYCDMNSVAPETKRAAAQAVEAADARYVDVAVMAPVRPALHRVPLLISGPHAADACAALRDARLNPRAIAGEVGAASAIKMIRSIMIKGLEALTAECLLSARAAGVDEEVIASLDASFPGFDWRARGDYNLDRMLVHGRRRAAEMREAAATARALGQAGAMADATVAWQRRLGDLALSPLPDGLAAKADAILHATGRTPA